MAKSIGLKNAPSQTGKPSGKGRGNATPKTVAPKSGYSKLGTKK